MIDESFEINRRCCNCCVGLYVEGDLGMRFCFDCKAKRLNVAIPVPFTEWELNK